LSLNAVQRLESLEADPLKEVIALARDPELPKPTRLKAWMALIDYAYPRLATVTLTDDVSAQLPDGLDLANPGVAEGKKILQAAIEGTVDLKGAMGLLKGIALVQHLSGDAPDEQPELLRLIKGWATHTNAPAPVPSREWRFARAFAER
jgi:hypothetical protein